MGHESLGKKYQRIKILNVVGFLSFIFHFNSELTVIIYESFPLSATPRTMQSLGSPLNFYEFPLRLATRSFNGRNPENYAGVMLGFSSIPQYTVAQHVHCGFT